MIRGKTDSTTRTADQTQIANFWKQATHVPFNAIARSVSKVKEYSVEQSARLFALLNITLADTRIAVWDAKYQYGYWRPITAINTVDSYGNADVTPDATWVPLIETPNHPEYPSGHSITGGGGARLLAQLFGDEVSFAVGSDTLPGVTRSFTKLSDAEQENANSRIYGGEGGAGGEDGVGAAGEPNATGGTSSGGGGTGGVVAVAGEPEEGAEAGEGGAAPSGGKGGICGTMATAVRAASLARPPCPRSVRTTTTRVAPWRNRAALRTRSGSACCWLQWASGYACAVAVTEVVP